VDLYFHAISIEEIMSNLRQGAGTCAELTGLTDNKSAPQANAGPDFTIPIGTAFVLRGSGSDGDNDPLTYCWEQMDNGFFVSPPVGTSVGGALYRSLPPVEERERYLPELNTLVQGVVSSKWEVTPLVARQLNFRLTVRDNNAEAGQVDSDDLVVTVTDAAGPFTVTSQSAAGIVWTPGAQENVTWNVAGTTGNGVNVSRVNIRLSTDGGKTFPVLLASNVSNDGSQAVSVPDSQAPNCRILVEAVGNFFFAMNATSFSIGEFNEVCVENTAQDTPINIPDNDPTGIVSEIEFTDEMNIEKVAVKINDLQHTFLGDLDISIESPSGTVVQLLSGACSGSEDIVNAVFEDSGAEIDCMFPPAAGISGSVRPFQALSAFEGESAMGTWKLKVIDTEGLDIGSLVSWSLEICTSEPVLGVNNFVFDGFKVFPNPSDGRFRVQFTSENVGDVEITMYDLMGRRVAERKYVGAPNSFDEELAVEGISSGLYILRVRRGNKISSQKITLE
jgi:subtilisin-like proprotein convertase family protein